MELGFVCGVAGCAAGRRPAVGRRDRAAVRAVRCAAPMRRGVVVMAESGSAPAEGRDEGGDDGPSDLPRKALMALSAVGLAETAFLTYKKLFGSGGIGSICTTAGCLEVLGGPYSSVFGVPLTLFGMGGYAAVLILASYPLTAPPIEAAERDRSTRSLLVSVSTAMATFSGYLMFVLFGVIQGWCPWCLLSAVVSEAIGLLVLSRLFSSQWRNSLASALFTAVAAMSLFVTTPGGVFDASVIRDPPAVTAVSTRESMELADRLQEKHTKMYGAYWCSHCFSQKQMLGKEAMKKIEYIECAERGRSSQSGLCREKRIPGYPSWEIDGKLFFGEQTVEDFDEILTTGGKADDPYEDLREELAEIERIARESGARLGADGK